MNYIYTTRGDIVAQLGGQGQQVLILPEGTNRFLGRDAQRMNILAGKVLAETVRTTLGPKGMDKMLVDGLGDIVVTNDGVTILKEMDIEHPAAKMLVEVAKTQEDEVGDGTTTDQPKPSNVVLARRNDELCKSINYLGVRGSSEAPQGPLPSTSTNL